MILRCFMEGESVMVRKATTSRQGQPRQILKVSGNAAGKKAIDFKVYLKERNITYFNVEALEDELNTTVFRSFVEIGGQQLPLVIILDDSVCGVIRIKVAGEVLRPENESAWLKKINQLNLQYKVLKYYFAEDSSLMLEGSVVHENNQLNGDSIYNLLDLMVKHLAGEYKNFMKLIWN